ncbi:MAG: hypothetical protein JNK30_18295 [Phenylobacterium sp.]|nr:hypothetical protein [Phenylobacterium sp.]
METANEKREEMFGALAELRGEVRGLVLALGLRQPEEGEEKPKSGALATWSLMKVLGVLGAVGGCLGLLVFLFQLAVKLWPHFVAYMMSLSPT